MICDNYNIHPKKCCWEGIKGKKDLTQRVRNDVVTKQITDTPEAKGSFGTAQIKCMLQVPGTVRPQKSEYGSPRSSLCSTVLCRSLCEAL